MKELNFETPDISIVKSTKAGIKTVVINIKVISRRLAVLTLLTALAVTFTVCGNVGIVKVDYNYYIPYHEISTIYVLKYIVGTVLAVALYMLWNGGAFYLLSHTNKTKLSLDTSQLKRGDFFFSGLRFVQFCMLSAITFGIIAAVLVYLSISISTWIWAAVAIYAIIVSVPLYVACYEYMLTDINFRGALKTALKYSLEQWGRIFLRLFMVSAAAALPILLFLIPAASLIMAVYDNATAVVMNGAEPSPMLIYVLEYVAVFIANVLMLAIVLTAMSVLRFFANDTTRYSQYLSRIQAEM